MAAGLFMLRAVRAKAGITVSQFAQAARVMAVYHSCEYRMRVTGRA